MTEQTPMIPPREPYYDDEISISELLMKLWAKRGLIVMLPLVLAGLTIVGLIFNKTSQQTILDYYIELNGISVSADADKGETGLRARYPNGVIFSPQDLLNPSVLQVLVTQYQLPVEQLRKNIKVDFGTPLTEGVLVEYRAAVAANSKATPDVLNSINERYQTELFATARRGLKISVDYVALGLSKEQGQQLAVDLATTWNTVFTTQFKTQINPSFISGGLSRFELDISTTEGFLAADNQLDQVSTALRQLASDGRLAGLTTEYGVTPSDLIGYLADFRTVYFDPLYVNAFSQAEGLSVIYRRDIQLSAQEISKEIEELTHRLTDIREFRGGSMAPAASSRDTVTSSAQYDGSALNEVVELAERAALSDYLTKTLDARRDLVSQRGSLETKLERIDDSSLSDISISEEFLQSAVARYKDVISSYAALMEAARASLIAETPSYFSPITQPNTSGRLLEKRDFLFIALALALGGMLAVIAALVWPQKS